MSLTSTHHSQKLVTAVRQVLIVLCDVEVELGAVRRGIGQHIGTPLTWLKCMLG